MTHPTDGTLLALIHGEPPADEALRLRTHLAECSLCSERLRALQTSEGTLVRALGHLDVRPRLVEARNSILQRAAAPAAPNDGSQGSAWWRSNLAKAAGLILVFAGAASAALPGSPVRIWLETRLVSDADVLAPESAEPESETDDAEAPPEVGVRLVDVDGAVRISVLGLAPGSEVLVELVDDGGSGVYAAQGARFQTGPGQVEANVPGSWVRIELSKSLGDAQVEVDGALYLRKIGDRLQLTGPDQDSADAQIRFRVPQDGP